MRVLLIAALAWTATARAIDIPKEATHEVQTCTTVMKGMIYDPPAIEKGAIGNEPPLVVDRYSWKDGDIEYVVTQGVRKPDGARIETFMKREFSRAGDIETEALQMTNRATGGGLDDSRSYYEVNEYKVDDKANTKTLQSRVVDNSQNIHVKETISTQPTGNGRIVTTTLQGPYTQKLSDVTGQYATIESQVRTCIIERPGQA